MNLKRPSTITFLQLFKKFGKDMKENSPKKIYRTTTYLNSNKGNTKWKEKPVAGAENIEYTQTNAFLKIAKEAFCKVTCKGHPPRSTCTSLGTCKEYDDFVKFMGVGNSYGL